MWLQKEHTPPLDVKKSVKTDPSGGAIYSYSRKLYLDGCCWFTQVEARELLAYMEEWIAP